MAVLFDLDGTLCGVEKPRKEILSRCIEKCGLPEISREEYLDAHDYVSQNCKIKTRLPIFKAIFRERGFDDMTKVMELSSLYRSMVLKNLYLFKGAIDVLESIKGEKILVTNGPDLIQRERKLVF